MFYSQQGEDITLYRKFLNYRDGFFIELGASGGIDYSNTLFFEKELGWKGVLIEPSKTLFNELKNCRSNCHCLDVAISQIEGEVDFIDAGHMSGLAHTMHDTHKNGWNLQAVLSYKVKSVPMSKITSDFNIKKIDLLSLDVEGGELEVLNSFDWNIPVYIILIEMAKHDLIKDEKCRDVMKLHGFVFDSIIGDNEIWVNIKNK